VYRLAVEELRELCVEQELDSSGPVHMLRGRLADHNRSNQMDRAEQDRPVVQASVPTDLESNGAESVPPIGMYSSHGGSGDGPVIVLAGAPVKCWDCGRPGHLSRNCPRNVGSPRRSTESS